MKIIRRIFIGILLLCVIAASAGGIYFYQNYMKEAEQVIANSGANDFKKHQNSVIYDKNGKVLVNLSENANSKYLIYQDIPKNVQNAFIAVEDRAFWKHHGVNVKGIARVLIKYMTSGGKEKHGASTITQQVIRNTFIGKEVKMDRKLREIAYSFALEQKYSKQNIMEFYINNIYFGHQQYGIESASDYYFGKSAKKLSLAETAYLCAIPNNPSYYDPLNEPNHTKQRQKKILKDMYETKLITSGQYKSALEETVVLNRQKTEQTYDDPSTYAIYCATVQIMKKDGFHFRYSFGSLKRYRKYKKKYNIAYRSAKEKLYTEGYRVYTSIDPEAQNKLQKAVDDGLKGEKKLQAAATSIDHKTGKVVAIVGGKTHKKKTMGLNRAFESKRQPGSAIKPILVYGPAIDSGYHAGSTLQNVAISKHVADYGSSISLEDALTRSTNGAAYWLCNQIGIKRCLNYLKKMEFGSIVGEDETLASSLGGMTLGVNTVEMASAYHCLLNDGKFIAPTCIEHMEDADGIGLYFAKEPKQIYKKTTAKELLSIMENVIQNGTAKNMKWNSKRFAAGKTGTTNDGKDAWFAGVTDEYSTVVWVGCDKPKANDELYGNTYPVKIWKAYNK